MLTFFLVSMPKKAGCEGWKEALASGLQGPREHRTQRTAFLFQRPDEALLSLPRVMMCKINLTTFLCLAGEL